MKSAGIHLEMVKVIQVEVFLHLPELITQARAVPGITVEDDGFAILYNFSPEMTRGAQNGIQARICVVYAL
jgi:hypothetical protein